MGEAEVVGGDGGGGWWWWLGGGGVLEHDHHPALPLTKIMSSASGRLL